MFNSKRSGSSLLEWLAILISMVVSVFAVFFLLVIARYGFDFTDEGFYLNWISRPRDFERSTTQFGFVYHPIYWLVKGDVGILRQLNILFTILISWWMLQSLFLLPAYKNLFAGLKGRFAGFSLSLAFALTALVFFQLWLPTPNYNSLNFQALMVVGQGILRIERKSGQIDWFGWFLIGIGGGLSFLAKPSSSVLLALVIAFYFSFSKPRFWRGPILSAITSATLLIAASLLIDGSLSKFLFVRIAGGVLEIQLLGGGHAFFEMLRFYSLHLSLTESALFFSVFALAVVPILLSKIIGSRCVLVSISVFIGILSSLLHKEILHLAGTARISILLLSLSLGVVVGSFLLNIRNLPGLKGVVLSISLLSLPYVYSFGTNNDYLVASSGVGLFWVVAGLSLFSFSKIDFLSWQSLVPTALVSQLVTCAVLYFAIEKPYRQPFALWENKEISNVRGATLVMDKGSAFYIEQVRRLAEENGFTPNTPYIDLSGHYPALGFLLNAKVLGHPWVLGGYVGSERHATSGLDRASCVDLATAWLLMEPLGPRAISGSILLKYGIKVAEDYEIVGIFQSLKLGYNETFEQILYKPKLNLRSKCE